MGARVRAGIEGPSAGEYVASLGLRLRGRAQAFVDSEVARLADPYVPNDTGDTRKSVFLLSDFGGGEVAYSLYHPGMYEDDVSAFQDAPMRGSRWVHRMLAAGGAEKIAEGLRGILGRRP